MNNIFGKFKNHIRLFRDYGKLCKKCNGKDSYLGKCINLKNPQYISLGKSVRIKDGFRIECYNDYLGKTFSPRFEIGDNVTIGYRFSALVADKMIIGNNTLIASDVLLTTENHTMNPETGLPCVKQPLSSAPIEIDEGCWIGEKAVILPGVKIGKNCIIAASAVVSTNIPAYCIAAGVPARVIKKYDFSRHEWISNR